MAEPLKNRYGIEVAQRLANALSEKQASFERQKFLRDCRKGYDELELMGRGLHIARTLKNYLPEDYPTAVSWLVSSLGAAQQQTENNGMAPFDYLPHTMFVSEYGLGHFDESMSALYEMTQRFTGEYSIRPFLEQETERSLKLLKKWAVDENVHVRRLVSEGTRPRLPWASRLRKFQQNPELALPLLEMLKDDPELYVRRSVANHLNDIGKDHPEFLCDVAGRWSKGADKNRQWVIRHALRSLVKQGYPAVFPLLGYADVAAVELKQISVEPKRVKAGESLTVFVELSNPGKKSARAIVDFQVWFMKSNGTHQPKTFKLKEVELAPGEELKLAKQISFREMTTRKHYPGVHRINALLNGVPSEEVEFRLV